MTRPRLDPALLLTLLLAAGAEAAAAEGPRFDPPVGPSSAEQPASAPASPATPERPLSLGTTLARDYGAFYSGRRLLTLGAVFAAGGVIANSSTDEELYGRFRDLRDGRSDGWATDVDPLGDAALVLPAILVPALLIGLGDRAEESAAGAWWRRSARAYAVGGPAFYYLQQITGGSRPGEETGSAWKPFVGNHGVSGHAFLGAVPLLTAARLTRNPLGRGAWIALSMAPALARLEQGQHYPSQVLLGWLLAWEATGAVADSSADHRRHWQVVPLAVEGGGGALVAWSLP
jgi:membrane-associated phospholipid phosphatase